MPNQIIKISPQQPNIAGLFREDMIFVLCDSTSGAFTIDVPHCQGGNCRVINFKNIGTNNVTLTFPVDMQKADIVITSGNAVDIFNDPVTGIWYKYGND